MQEKKPNHTGTCQDSFPRQSRKSSPEGGLQNRVGTGKGGRGRWDSGRPVAAWLPSSQRYSAATSPGWGHVDGHRDTREPWRSDTTGTSSGVTTGWAEGPHRNGEHLEKGGLHPAVGPWEPAERASVVRGPEAEEVWQEGTGQEITDRPSVTQVL